MATAAVNRLLQLTPATAEEVEKFVSDNRRWIDDTVAAELRGMNGLDQRRVVSGGTIVSCRDASGVIRSRVRQAKEKEALLSGIHASQTGDNAAAAAGMGDRIAVIMQGGGGKLSRPATQEEVEAFVASNRRWLSEEAEEILKVMSPVDQKRVIAAGTLSGCRDPVAVVQTRAKRAREMELEFEQLTRGKQEKVNEPTVPVPKFSAEVGAAYIFAKPEEVKRGESRFAPPPAKGAADAGSGGQLVGEARGVGGVVEILRAKYGCSRGQRLRVIGETNGLLQFEGGKTVPKNHEGSGYRWVLRSDEEAAKPQSGEASRQPNSEPPSKSREDKVAFEVKTKDKERLKTSSKRCSSQSSSSSHGRREKQKKKR